MSSSQALENCRISLVVYGYGRHLAAAANIPDGVLKPLKLGRMVPACLAILANALSSYLSSMLSMCSTLRTFYVRSVFVDQTLIQKAI